MFPILTGIVGSTAYGLAGPDSDVDTLGIFTHPTEAFFGLKKLDETKSTTDPDITMHETAKFCRLALGGNPTVMELMWLPRDLYTFESRHGLALIGIREAFLSAPRVRDAYLGYATQQFKKLKERGRFSSDTQHRTAKHARHLLRLLNQGVHLYLTGELKIRVDDPEFYMWFGKRAEEGNTLYAEKALSDAEEIFDLAPSYIPDKPDVELVESWLEDVRRSYLDRPKRTE